MIATDQFVEKAHALHALGFHVFPTDHPDHPQCIGKHHPIKSPCDGKRGKHPAVTWGTWAVTVTPQLIDLAWSDRGGLANIAIACGPSGLVVLDEDERGELDSWCAEHGITLPDTYTVTTGRGRHLVFRWDHGAQRIGNSEKPFKGYKINVRGDGGYVIAEGSRHMSGATYTGNGLPPADLPPEVAELLLAGVAPPRAESNAQSSREHPGGNPNSTKIPDGERHHALVTYAGRLRKSGLDYHEAEPAFRRRWLLCEQPEGQIAEAKFHSITCRYPVTWEEARRKLSDVFTRYAAGENPTAGTGDGGVESPSWSFTDGASFILDIPDAIPALWGTGSQVLWAEGESLMIAGLPGLGKTTLAGLLMRAQLCPVGGQVLGLPVTPRSGTILYLAMDRPAQIARSLHRQFGPGLRTLLAERVLVWRGPPPDDVSRHPKLLVALAEEAGADTVYLDSVKDAAIGLSDDAVGAGYNRARQILLAEGKQLIELHHTVKRGAGGGAPDSIADIYGSAWLTNGTGSVVLLTGKPGDPIVGFRHLRSPAEEVGPLVLLHNETLGAMDIHDATDLVALVAAVAPEGLTAKAAAMVIFEVKTPTRGEIEKARRKLDKLAGEGRLRWVDGVKGGPDGGTAAAWVLP